MANEYLQRTPTSTGNRKVWTLAGWIKLQKSNFDGYLFHAYSSDTNRTPLAMNGAKIQYRNIISGSTDSIETKSLYRDAGSWLHFVISTDTTQSDDPVERVKIYINGKLLSEDFNTAPSTTRNSDTFANASGIVQRVFDASANGTELKAEVFDWFLIDGQALTPDVFGFYKQGKGYISVGSTQATDFRPGQWVPKTPRVIKTEINRRGGFGVNGFYLPMNDSNNFGADFHCDPNSIITLNEKLPQPRVGVATTASVGLGYTDALRADPYAANLVLAIPGVIGGQGSGYGDYSANIKGSGSNKTVTAFGNAGVAVTASYYGSALSFDGSGDYIDIASSPDYNLGTSDYTIECWVNPITITTTGYFKRIWDLGSGLSNSLSMTMQSTDSSFKFRYNDTVLVQSDSNTVNNRQWSHVCLERFGTRLSLYINGVSVGIVTNHTTSYDYSSNTFRIGQNHETDANGQASSVNGYIQDFRFYKGVAKYKGGFDVPRPYTPVGIATWRAVPDTTANNFATWNAVQNSMSLTDGNLTCTGTGSNQEVYSTVGITTGKWYVEARTNVGIYNHFGVRANSTTAYDATYRLIARDDGNVYGDTSQGQIGTLSSGYASAGSIVAMAIDGNLGQITYYVNGINVGGPYSIYQYNSSSLPTSYKIYNLVNSGDSLTVNFGQNPTFSGNTTAGTFTDSNGKGLFKYQPPSGFLALCEDNLPTPAISDPGKYFKTVLWTGDGNNGRSIVGVGFTPDLVWIKSRNNASYGHKLFDSIRGPKLQLESNATDGDISVEGVYSFNSDGFSIGSYSAVNQSTYPFVAWCWRAGAGTTSTNTNGSITSVVSVNQDAGFSIVSYTGSASNATVGHGLGRVPKFILIKKRNESGNWMVYHSSLTGQKYLEGLNTTSATGINNPSPWNNTDPTSSVITLLGAETNVSGSGRTYIAYCWAEIEGFSKFGSYVGNGNADGPMVWCGFKPAWVMIKRTDSTGNWCIHDSSRGPVNVMNEQLQANLSNVESGTGGLIDFLSNGFKIRATSTDLNASGGTYIFAAFAETPFQTANSK